MQANKLFVPPCRRYEQAVRCGRCGADLAGICIGRVMDHAAKTKAAMKVVDQTLLTLIFHLKSHHKIGLRAIDVCDATLLRLWQPLPVEPG